MDNISKKRPLSTIAKIANICQIIFPVIVDFLGLISLFTSALNNWISTNIGLVPSIIIITILNVVLIANVIFLVDRKLSNKINITFEFILGYERLLKLYMENVIDFDEQRKNISTVEDLYSCVSEHLKTLIDEMNKILCKATGKDTRICVKAFPEIYNHTDTSKMELMTFCRSDKSLSQSNIERKDRVNVKENTDFDLIMSEEYPYFAFNNLQNYLQETQTEYRNTTIDWHEKYNATIVFPISKCIAIKRGKETHQILGFICADTLSLDAFTSDTGTHCVKFLSSVSFLLYIFLEKCIEYRKMLEIITTLS